MMTDHNVLRNEISSARRYLELKELELSIYGLRNRLPVSLYTELSGRVKEKVMSFEFSDCNNSKINVIYSNGLSRPIEPEECHLAMSRGDRISDYVFSHYISARDIEIVGGNSYLKEGQPTLDHSNSGTAEVSIFTALSPSALSERIDFLMKKMENLEKIEKIYTDNIPKIVNDMNDLRDKVNKIYKVLIKE